MTCLDQEVIVKSTVLEVMYQRRPVCRHLLNLGHGVALHDTAVAQQHVGHLEN